MNFLLAIATTIGMTVIPFLITDSLGLSLLWLGILEGVTEFMSNAFRLGNGMLFDKIKNKRNIFVFSTGLAFASKALLFLPSQWAVLFAKTLERIANGTFAAPRDAFVAGNSKNRGFALGLLNVSKTLGCVIGPLVVSITAYFGGPVKDNLVLFIALCCALSFPALIFSFTLTVEHVVEKPFDFKAIPSVFKTMLPILVLVFLFFLGRFNDGLLMMFLRHNNYPDWFYLSTIAVFNSTMMLVAPIIGSQADKGDVKRILYVTILALCVFNICFFSIGILNIGMFNIGILGWIFAILGLCTWGIQRAGAQIVFSILVFRSVDKTYYGTAIGIFYIISGFGTMLSSFLCGFLASKDSFVSVFLTSGFFAFLALGYAAFVLHKGVSWNRSMVPAT